MVQVPPPPHPFSPTSLLSPTTRQRHVPLPDSVEQLIARICAEQSLSPPDYHARLELARLGESASMQILGLIASSRVRTFSGYIMHMARNSPIAMARYAEGLSTRQSSCFSGPSVEDGSDTSSDDWTVVERGPIPSDQELASRGRVVNSPPTVLQTNLPHLGANGARLDERVFRRLEIEMDQAGLRNYDNYCYSSIPQRVEPSCERVPSPQMMALGNLEFRKAFLILCYLGRISAVGGPILELMCSHTDSGKALFLQNSTAVEISELWLLARAKLEHVVSMELLRDLTGMPMEAFEFRIWKEFGMKNIKPTDRRKILDWDPSKTYVYHCHVDLQGNVTFKGPFLESTKTHLQRVLGDENILQVKFEEISQEKRTRDDFKNYYCMYHRVAEQGIELGLRRYQFLVYKDGGKEEKKKSGTNSSVKCYFVRTDSGWNRDRDTDFLYAKTVKQIRLSLMHIDTVSSLAKYISRLSLVLSKTLKLNIDLSDPELNVEIIPDIRCKDGSAFLKGIHTDGTGFISEDLALQCPSCVSKGNIQAGKDGLMLGPASLKRQKIHNNDGAPLLMQVRLFYYGLCAKGTLLVNKLLPKKTIQIRSPSMVKVDQDTSMWRIVKSFNSLEVVNTSNRPKKVHLSRYLIALLHFGGVPAEFFLGLLSSALAEAESCRYDRSAALKVALNHEGIDNDRLTTRMIMSGMPLDEPFLQYRLGLMMGEEKKGLLAGKIAISDCYYLMGTADPTGKLGPNQVCVILDQGQLSGDVLVYKHPGLHPGDIHLLQATFVEGLDKFVGDSKYAIFFPVVGPRSLADEMANSDFDGDIYWVSRHPELLKHFKPSPPWLAPEEHSSNKREEKINFATMNSDALEGLLFHSFLKNRFEPSYTVGLAAECWLVYMDRLLTPGVEKEEVWSKIEKLINIYYDALDAPKTGKKVEVGNDLKVERYPHFMEKNLVTVSNSTLERNSALSNSKRDYISTSILGLIYDKVQSFKVEKLHSTKFEMLPCFSVKASKSCMDKWTALYNNYLKEMREALGIQEKDMRNNRCQEIIDCYKKILYGAKEFKRRTRPEFEIEDEALAIYQIVYKKAQIDGVEKCGFAWRVAGEVLCKYYASSQDDDNDVFYGSFKVMHEVFGVKN